jgi:hypothetical protein
MRTRQSQEQQPLISQKPVATAQQAQTRLARVVQQARSKLKFFVGLSILNVYAAAIWIMAGAGALWTGYLLIAVATTWLFFYVWQYRIRREVTLGLSFFAVLLVLAFYWNFAVEQYQGFSAFLKSSPCGQSSCSHQIDQDNFPYNPHGFLPSVFGETSYLSTKLSFCFCKGCAWASNNGQAILGYPAINGTHLPDTSAFPIDNGGLATTNPNDFLNGGAGLGGGNFVNTGSTVAPVVPCPGVSSHLTPGGLVGQGYVICAACLNELRKQTGYSDPFTDLSCPPSLYPPWTSGMCWLCPDPSTCPYLVTITWVLFEVTLIILINWICDMVF